MALFQMSKFNYLVCVAHGNTIFFLKFDKHENVLKVRLDDLVRLQGRENNENDPQKKEEERRTNFDHC